MEPDQLLKVLGLGGGWQFFLYKMRKDGRITIPKIVLILLGEQETSLTSHALEVMIEPCITFQD